MDILYVKDINLVKYKSNGYGNSNQALMALSIIPGYQIRGYSNHYIIGYQHEDFLFDFGKTDFFLFNMFMDSGSWKNKLLDIVGNFLDLKKFYYDNGTYSYKLLGYSNQYFIPKFAYYYNNTSNLKLFFVYGYRDGEERTEEIDTIYFHRIIIVDFNHTEFMSFF